MDNPIYSLENIIATDYSNIAGICVVKDGTTLYENYFNGCAASTQVHVFSVTKSVISILIGIAMDQGHIQSVEQNVLEFFPEYKLKRGEKTIQTVKLRHMLTMTAPYKYKSAPYTKYFTSGDWVKSALDLLGGKKPPGEFRYTPLIGPDILSGILVKATGRPVRGFAIDNLFGPLGISVDRDIVFKDKADHLAFIKQSGISGWASDPMGVNTAGWGLTLSARDMAKIGQLCVNGGRWENRQIVSAGWIGESTKEHSRWDALGLSFGYLWWASVGDGYAAMGDSGNVIYINPGKKMVVSIASLYKPTAKDRVELIIKYIEPLF